jgi:hypothetical protein
MVELKLKLGLELEQAEMVPDLTVPELVDWLLEQALKELVPRTVSVPPWMDLVPRTGMELAPEREREREQGHLSC